MTDNRGQTETMEVRNAKTIGVDRIPVERVSIGAAGDYKPCVAQLADGTLLVSAYRTSPAIHGTPYADYHDWNTYSPDQRKVLETTLLFRSVDGGRTWSPPRLANIAGKEPYLSVMSDGTLLLTAHLVYNNLMNREGYGYGLLHRSPDGGRSWYTMRAQPQNVTPARHAYYDLTTRNVLQLEDGSLFFVASGTGRDGNTVWRSKDGGVSWNLLYGAEVEAQPDGYFYSLFGEGVLWQARSGKIYCIARVDWGTWEDAPDNLIVDENLHDQSDRLILLATEDLGRTWQMVRHFADYGQMYPAILRLIDGRLLLTFTQRANDSSLGLRATVGVEHEDGFEFDLQSDLIMIDTKTPEGMPSGGGFGCTVRLDDGTLVTSYSYRTRSDEFAGAYAEIHSEIARWRLP